MKKIKLPDGDEFNAKNCRDYVKKRRPDCVTREFNDIKKVILRMVESHGLSAIVTIRYVMNIDKLDKIGFRVSKKKITNTYLVEW
jgi:hypothetical protein